MNVWRFNTTLAAVLLTMAVILLAACAPAPVAPATTAPITEATTAPATTEPTTAPTAPPTALAPTLEPTTAPKATGGRTVKLTFGPGRDATQPGTAELTAQDDKTQVVIDMQPVAAGAAQPAHIHQGSCPGVGAVKFPLTNVVDGKSTTTVNSSLDDLLKGGFSINVHKSTSEVSVYVACVNLAESSASGAKSVNVTLGPGRDASQTGTAVLTAQDDKTQVVVSIQPGPAGVAQPAHIHAGKCPGVGSVKFPLTNVVDGKSTTVVNASLDALLKEELAVNVHKSTSEVGVYVACGELKGSSSLQQQQPSAEPVSSTPGYGGY